MYRWSFPYLLLIALTALSCGKPDKSVLSREKPLTIPTMIVVENVIEGEILGSKLSKPYGLAVDFRGNLYAVDAGNARIIKFSADLAPLRDLGGYGGQEGLLDRPSFVSVDNGLNLMVTDEGNRRICRYNSQLVFVDELKFYDDEDMLKFGYPAGLAFTDYGEVWVSDRDNNRVAVFNNVGKFDRFLGDFGYAGGQLDHPEEIVRTRDGSFIVCDAGNSRVVIYDKYGNFSSEMELPDMGYPAAADAGGGLLWVLDTESGTVNGLDYEGSIYFSIGPSMPGDNTSLKQASDILVLPADKLLISDSGNNRILVCRIVYEDN